MKKILTAALAMALLLSACAARAMPGEIPGEMPVVASGTASEATEAFDFSMPALPASGTPTDRAYSFSVTTNIDTTITQSSSTSSSSLIKSTSAMTSATTTTTSTVKATIATTTKTNTSSPAATTRTSASAPTPAATVTTTTTAQAQPSAGASSAAASVTLSVDGSAAVPYGYNVSLPARSIALNSGESVLDLLKKSGAAGVEHYGSGRMAYVRAINGLREKDCGGGSGWVYEVNGMRIGLSCGAFQPKDGDVITWRYSLTP